MKSGISSTKRKLFFSTMIFAFSLVILGDLLSIHLELIYGNKKSDFHSPFTKTQKNDSKTFKKDFKKDSSSKKKQQLSYIGEKTAEVTGESDEYCFFRLDNTAEESQDIPPIPGRGPPELL